MEEPTKLIYIVSPSFSGSTLLTFLLATHPQVSTIGERKKFYSKMMAVSGRGSQSCSCGRPFAECKFWCTVKEGIIQRIELPGVNFSTFELFQNSFLNMFSRRIIFTLAVSNRLDYLQLIYPLAKRFNEIIGANRALICSVLDVSRGTTFLDSSKNITHALYLDYARDLDVYVVWLLRDGRGQVYSTIRREHAETIDEAALQWVRTIKIQRKLLRKWRGKWLSMKYEDLCSAPESELNSIYQFCGIDPDQFSLEFRNYEQHIMGNPMRLANEDAIVDKQAWRTQFSLEQLTVFSKIAGPLNQSLGYE